MEKKCKGLKKGMEGENKRKREDMGESEKKGAIMVKKEVRESTNFKGVKRDKRGKRGKEEGGKRLK